MATINEHSVGTLTEERGRWAFQYTADWLASPESFALSPQLSLQSEPHIDNASQRQVQWYFDNLLPEEGQRTLLAQDATIEQADTFSLLAHYGAESAGSLTLRSENDPVDSSVNTAKDLSDAALQQRIDQLPTLPLAHGAVKRMSLAGAQHKLAVVYQQNHLYEPQGSAASTHILKPDHLSTAFPQSVINEWFMMKLAKNVGLTVPEVHRHYVPSAVYIIERFDRRRVDGQVERLHSIDACQLLGMDASYKYQQGSVERLVELASACRSTALTRTRLYSWLVFNVLVGNTDAHLKNLSFMVSVDGIELAPIYDLLSTAVYETRAFDGNTWPSQTRMAWPLPGAETVSDISRAVLLEAGRRLGLNKATATRLLDYQLDRILAAAQELYEQMLVENKDQLVASAQQGVRIEAENRCIRTVIHNIIKPMVVQLAK